jgi:hypothetical protein
MPFKTGEPRPANSGRKKGTRNKRTVLAQDLVEAVGIDPLEFLLRVAKGDHEWLGVRPKDLTLFSRQRAASDAAPYVHAKLKHVEHSGEIAGGLLGQILGEIDGSDESEDQE